MLGEDGLVRDGKSEGMMIGIMLAMLCDKSYVAFTDADNYIPGAVWEYARNFAAGFIMATSPYVMVRNLWRYKPKISKDMYFRKWGRVSEICNRYMNMIISSKTGFETDIIKTANSGEHAMSMELVELLPYATGFAVEPYELLFLFEQFGGILPMGRREAVKQGIEIFQIETRNPHLHEEKGDEHLGEMLVPALSLFYHSVLCEPDIKSMIIEELQSRGSLKSDEEPPKPLIIPPLKKAKMKDFAKVLGEHLPSYSTLET
jgi:mannosyl-3-phosphoglycerate synthase